MSEICSECEGCGKKAECEACENKGWVEDPEDGGNMTCPDCNGEAGQDCDSCEGTGQEE